MDGDRHHGGTATLPQPAGGFDRTPPQHLDAEVAVLGAALLSRTALAEVVEIVHPDDFYRSAHRTVFEAVLELFSRGESVDPITVADRLSRAERLDDVGGASAIHDLVASVPTAANAVYYARIVREKAILRRLIEAGTRVVSLGYEGHDDVNVAVDRAEQLIYDVAQRRVGSEYSSLKELLSEGFERIEQRYENRSEVTGLATGFDDLDRLTAGLQKQNLVIVAARPSVGKSTLCLNIAQYVAVELRRPVIVFSLEMSKGEIVDRILSAEARIDSFRIRNGRLDDADWASLSDAIGRLAEAPLFIDDSPAITLMEIRSKCRRLKQRHGLDLVVIDYLQLMQSHRRIENRQQEVSEISRGCKMLAKELDLPVIALSQLSRQPETRADKRPLLADLRESGCLTRRTRLIRADTGSPITFGELIDEEARHVRVWARDARGRLVPGLLTHAFPSGRQPVYRVTLRSGTQVEATANHPFLTLAGWVPLGELSQGSRVATAREIPEPISPAPMDADEVISLARLIGDGTTVAHTSADEANLDAGEKATCSRLGVAARRVADGRSARTTQLDRPSPHRHTQVPAAVFSLPNQQVRLFLRHLWATAGCVRARRDGRRGSLPRIYYATTSRRLGEDVRLLLLRIGVVARIEELAPPRRADGSVRGPTSYHVHVDGVDQQRRFRRDVSVHGARGDVVAALVSRPDPDPNVDTIPRQVRSAVGSRRAECALEPTDEALGDLASNDPFWDEIRSIEPIGEHDVFDATVSEHHNFVAEGVILHNSLEQDADVVSFIYRDEVYDPDSPDRGVAELLVAKHRNGPTGVVKLAFLDHLTRFANLSRVGV